MKRSVIIVFCSIIFLVPVLGYLIYDGRIRFNYPDNDKYPILGIDISHHQGKINWNKLRSENINFVIIKATEGGDYRDPMFTENWKSSHDEGYKTGAYHFYRLCKTGTEQAANFIQTVPHDSLALPPTVDLEFGGNCETNKSKETILQEVTEFLTILEDHYKKKPIIYVTREFYDEYLVDNFKEYPLWIRSIYGKPQLKNGRDWHIWQFANRGHLHGIDTYVDLNVLNGKSFDQIMIDRGIED